MTEQYTTRYITPEGLDDLQIITGKDTLIGLHFEQKREKNVVYDEIELGIIKETYRWLDCYFNGRIPDFVPPLLIKGTPFQLKVWDYLHSIPYGATVTYGELARRFSCNMSAQAIGHAIGKNPINIIIPCHRVIGIGDRITGYNGGIENKKMLLAHEKCSLQKNP
ncbi:MAG: methylated-DNA--[protein]-cysteine S-methyltransferase [Bacteroidales bacterium]|nr:methylated-DNA--[protein]-cysteine S-methyltransferase [Bacteroidales bacterium]